MGTTFFTPPATLKVTRYNTLRHKYILHILRIRVESAHWHQRYYAPQALKNHDEDKPECISWAGCSLSPPSVDTPTPDLAFGAASVLDVFYLSSSMQQENAAARLPQPIESARRSLKLLERLEVYASLRWGGLYLLSSPFHVGFGACIHSSPCRLHHIT